MIANIKSQPAHSLRHQMLPPQTALDYTEALVIHMNPLTRMTTVLPILRHALGLQSTTSNQVLVVLALFLNMFV
ncbi:flagellar type III secretion system pore protein FliP, partial [Pseudomonas aeruginosa]